MSEPRQQFEKRIEELVTRFEQDVDREEWVTRRYPKRLRDETGAVYQIPALDLQKGPVKLLLDPIGHDVPGSAATADLYLMPAYDATTSLYHEAGEWRIYHAEPVFATNPHTRTEPQVLPLTPATINQVLNAIADHAVLSI